MPDPPSATLFTRYVLENPWPLGLGLLLIAAVVGWTGLREGLRQRVQAAGAIGAIGALVLALGILVVTAAERGKAVVRQLVNAVVAGDTVAAVNLFADDAVFALVSPQNPGFGLTHIRDELTALRDRYTIDSNTITMLRGYTESPRSAEVHLACLTRVSGFTNTSQWVLRVQRTPDEQWKIAHITWVSLNGQRPPSGF